MTWLQDLTEGYPEGLRLALLLGLPWLALLGVVKALLPLPSWVEYRMSQARRQLTGRPLPAMIGEACGAVTRLGPSIRRAVWTVVILLSLLAANSVLALADEAPLWAARIEQWAGQVRVSLTEGP